MFITRTVLVNAMCIKVSDQAETVQENQRCTRSAQEVTDLLLQF